MATTKTVQTHLLLPHYTFINPEKQTNFNSTFSNIILELKSLFLLSFPITLTSLIFYTRSIVSMLFLGHLGDLELAAGSLAIALANITGYSILSGLSLGMEPQCSQAFSANRPKLLSITLHRYIIFLLSCSIPISLLWLNISKILLLLHQEKNLTLAAQTYLLFSLPDLITNSFIHPITIYLRSQNITHPLTLASLFGAILHLPFNYCLVNHLNLGVAGVATASAASNIAILIFLVCHVYITGLHKPTWTKPSLECFNSVGFMQLLKLAGPSCVSVCLEWWWYQIMIVLCGLLVNPTVTVASMGVMIQTTSLIYVFPSSLGFAVSTRVGNELGANRAYKAKLSAVVSVFMAAIMGFSAMVFATAMRHRWGRMFTEDEDILRLTAAALPILGLCELGKIPQTVACWVVRGTARQSVAAIVNLIAFYLVGMPVAVGLGFWYEVGFYRLWLGLLLAQVCCVGLMLCVIGTIDWDFEARLAQQMMLANESNGQNGMMDVHKEPLTSVVTLTL